MAFLLIHFFYFSYIFNVAQEEELKRTQDLFFLILPLLDSFSWHKLCEYQFSFNTKIILSLFARKEDYFKLTTHNPAFSILGFIFLGISWMKSYAKFLIKIYQIIHLCTLAEGDPEKQSLFKNTLCESNFCLCICRIYYIPSVSWISTEIELRYWLH